MDYALERITKEREIGVFDRHYTQGQNLLRPKLPTVVAAPSLEGFHQPSEFFHFCFTLDEKVLRKLLK